MPTFYKGPRARPIWELVTDGVLEPLARTPRPTAIHNRSLRCELLDHVAAVHEASHVVWAHVHHRPILDVRIDGQGAGGGEFRHSERSTVG
jgi:hypothetical protein